MLSRIRLHKIVLDYVKKHCLEYTAPEIQRNIQNYGVCINGKLVYNRLEWVYLGEDISLNNWPQRSHGEFADIRILRENSEFLLIFKPVGVVVEPGAGHQTHNLLNWLENKYQQKVFLVHRLDKDTQGLLLIAKTETSQHFFQEQFRNRTTVKKYIAVVDKPVDNLLIIQNWQSRDKTNPIKQKFFWTLKEALKYDSSVRDASSIIKPLFYNAETKQTIVEVEIKTGRMHQIRLQCEALGFPLVAEKTYNSQLSRPKDTPSLEILAPAKRIQNLSFANFTELKSMIFGQTEYCLLASYLKIQTPDGAWLEVEYKKPEKF